MSETISRNSEDAQIDAHVVTGLWGGILVHLLVCDGGVLATITHYKDDFQTHRVDVSSYCRPAIVLVPLLYTAAYDESAMQEQQWIDPRVELSRSLATVQ